MTSPAADEPTGGAAADAVAGAAAATRMTRLMGELYPLPRSITGDGVRATLAAVGRQIPLAVHEVPSGTSVLDWTVPKEWNVRAAWIKDPHGRLVVDLRESSLHVLGYSIPVRARLPLAELRPHLHTLPDRPDWTPYRTSYYAETWGFCLPHRRLLELAEGEYEVVVDATLTDGQLTYGEAVLPGRSPAEVLVSTHVCHPALANDNLTGIAVATELARHLAAWPRRFTYRFLFVPGTIGSITWLARNRDRLHRVRHGLVLTGLGGPGPLTYKRSRRGDSEIDRIASFVLSRRDGAARLIDFSPYGYDERQFCSPGFNLPVGRFSRTPHGEYPEYHTSADNLQFVRADALADAFDALTAMIDVVEHNRRVRNLAPHGEPQLGRRGLYRSIGATIDRDAVELALLWVLSLSDGGPDLLGVAMRSGLGFEAVASAAAALEAADLVADDEPT